MVGKKVKRVVWTYLNCKIYFLGPVTQSTYDGKIGKTGCLDLTHTSLKYNFRSCSDFQNLELGKCHGDGDDGHVLVIWSEYCDTGVKLSENLKKVGSC